MPAIVWFRRDLRLADNPAVLAAFDAARADGDGRVVPLFVVDPLLWDSAGDVRQASLAASLAALDSTVDEALLYRYGDPADVLPEVARAAGARTVHIATDYGRYGQARDERVATALAAKGVQLVRTGSPYAVAPGRVLKADGTPYRVYTPFHRAWMAHGWRSPAGDAPDDAEWWLAIECEGPPTAPEVAPLHLPARGEQAALELWSSFRRDGLSNYADLRNRADLAGTSGLSAALRWGEVHPRTLLADLDDSPGAEVFRKELAWREFYADVTFHHPQSVRESLDPRFAAMRYDEGAEAETRFQAWCEGRTGFPFVDAGMRQLLAEGWMHNRVRMVVASFLVKDLHLPWWRGARWFMQWLRDGDAASNAQGWQWTAGCGTDAAPYFRIFNPVTQGLRFDPDGDYVRRYLPELRHLTGKSAHEPWLARDGLSNGYPARVVDHAVERDEALARFAELGRE